MALKLRRFDVVDFLKTDEDIQYYLAAMAEDNDPPFTVSAIGDVARAYGMSQLARETGISRMGLTKALSSEGNPSFATISKVLDALGYRFDIVPKSTPSRFETPAPEDETDFADAHEPHMTDAPHHTRPS